MHFRTSCMRRSELPEWEWRCGGRAHFSRFALSRQSMQSRQFAPGDRFGFPCEMTVQKPRFPGGAEKCLEAPSFYLLLCRTTLEFFMNAPQQSSPIVSSPLIFAGIAFPERTFSGEAWARCARSLLLIQRSGRMKCAAGNESSMPRVFLAPFACTPDRRTHAASARRAVGNARLTASVAVKKATRFSGRLFSISRAVSPKPSGRNV
jgi:hypothetical protein